MKIYNGVLHVGDLLAQHMVSIVAYVCLYPLKFAIFGELVEKTTRKYLKKNSTYLNQWKSYYMTVPPF